MTELLIAEDEKNVREGLQALFLGAGYAVRAVRDGAQALAAFESRRPHLTLLDVMMPKMDGFEVLAAIRRLDPLAPVLLITALGTAADKIKGLGLGADDYVTKPFKVSELLARVARAVARAAAVETRVRAAEESAPEGPRREAADAETFTIGGALVDPRERRLLGVRKNPVDLTAREVGILRLLARHPGEVIGRDHLLGTLWGMEYFGNTRTLDQHMAQIRKKLGRYAAAIETVFGVGYRYNATVVRP